MKKVINFLKSVLETIETGFYYFTLTLSKGFFFYFYLIALILSKLIPIKFFKNLKDFFQKRQNDTLSFLCLVFIFMVGAFFYAQFNSTNNVIKYVTKDVISTNEVHQKMIMGGNNESNLYNRYADYNINALDFKKLKKDNDEIVAWIMVDRTNINYPIVKTFDNDFYLNHDIKKHTKGSGWPFMDYRNRIDLSDDNTIIYGHNLANKTSFGSLTNLFTKEWFKESNHYIMVVTPEGKHLYEIFSIYTIDPEVYYLQNKFKNNDDLDIFFNTLKKRSIYKFKVDVSKEDKILTLSTCTDDNKQRRVVHAKLIKGVK